MRDILKRPENAEKLLRFSPDTMLLIDKDGVCVDMSVYVVDLWFMKEEVLLDKNVFELMPQATYREIYPEFQRVLQYKIRSVRDYEMTLKDKTYYFKCIMQKYDDDLVLCQYRDITGRTLQKQELEMKQRELTEIRKAAHIGNWQYDTNTQQLQYHGNTGVLCTDKMQEIALDDYAKQVIPEDRKGFLAWLDDNLKGNLEQKKDYRIQLGDKIFYIRAKVFRRERRRDGSTLLEGYIQNVSDLHRQRNDINAMTHAMYNCTEDVYAAREDGTLVFGNKRFRDRHHIKEEQDISKFKIYELPSYGRSQENWQKFAESIKNEEIAELYTVATPDPTNPNLLGMEASSYWVTDDNGVGYVWTFGRDISIRLIHEQQIKQYNQVLDKIFENLPAGIVVKDINNDFKYIYRNRESYNNMQITKKTSAGMNDFDFHPHDIAVEKRKQDQQIADTGQEMHWVTEERDLDGNIIYLDKRKMKIGSDDDSFSPVLLTIEWNITELEKMKRELIAAKEKAETSDRLKSVFLANMSHEIRTPLNAIVGFSRIIAECEDPNDREEYFKIVEQNNERLLLLINEILDLSKMEAGIIEFHIAPVRLQPLCKEVYDAHLIRCPEGVELIFEEPDKDIVVEADKARLFQVVSNIIGNAFKYTTEGSVSFGYKQEGDTVVFHVSDTGAGIPADKIDKIFERFVKANDFVQGTGLGLSICKTIVERLGGTISCASEEGKGTTFTFTLPIHAAAQGELDAQILSEQDVPVKVEDAADTVAEKMAEEDDDEPVTGPPTKTILVAEDTESNYTVLKAMIGRYYNLQRANDGMEAVTMFEEVQPDLILMDMRMPNLSGIEATRIIHEVNPDTPIIALTAYAYDHDEETAREAGCCEFLNKPFTKKGLLDAIRKWIN